MPWRLQQRRMVLEQGVATASAQARTGEIGHQDRLRLRDWRACDLRGRGKEHAYPRDDISPLIRPVRLAKAGLARNADVRRDGRALGLDRKGGGRLLRDRAGIFAALSDLSQDAR